MTNFILPTSTQRAIALSVISLTVLGISGCASQNYLYNAGKDKQGQIAATSARDVQLVDTVNAAEKRYAQLLDLEIEAVKSRFKLIRDYEIREIALSNTNKKLSETWVKRIELRQALIRPGDKPENIGAAKATLSEENNKLLDIREELERVVKHVPDCDVALQNEQLASQLTKQLSERDKTEAVGFYKQLRTKCSDLVAAQKVFETASGLLGKSQYQLATDEAALNFHNQAKAAAETQLAASVDAYKAAMTGLSPSSTSYADKLSVEAARLLKAVKGIEDAQKVAGIEVVARSRLDRIEELLTQLTEGSVSTSQWSEDQRAGVALMGTLPALADEARKMLRETVRPRIVPLILAKEHQRLVVEEASQVNVVISRRIEASRNIVRAYNDEYKALTTVGQKLKEGEMVQQTLQDLNLASKPEQRRKLYEALGIYFDDVPRYQLAQHIWEYRRLATFYDESIEHSKYAALMWQNLNQGIANTLAGYHGSGIKPETIAEFLKALGVILIGAGVL